jgi:hypothetical protein
MATHIFLPPIAKTTGGVAVLLKLARALRESGREVALVPRETLPEDVAADPPAPLVPWERLALKPDDVWLVPEGWPNALAPGLAAKARCLVYCQNAAFLFSGLPAGVGWAQLPVGFLAVSQPMAWFVEQALGVVPPVLRPGIDLALFSPPEGKPAGPVRIGFMPRKNKALGLEIRAVLAARLARLKGPAVDWVELAGLTQAGVAEALRGCHVFLATGFPEGCPLPPLEALASGCLAVGFAGLGGFDYMRQIEPGGYRPACPLREVPWAGNGFYAADGDVITAALGLETAARWVAEGDPRLAAALAEGRKTAQAYSLEAFAANVDAVWREMGL